MRAALGIFEEGAQTRARSARDDGFVGFDNIHPGAEFSQFARDDVAGDPGTS